MTAPAVLDPTAVDPRSDAAVTTALQTGAGGDGDVPTAGAVALVVDDSAAAIAAAGWAARLANEKRTSLVVVVLEPAGQDAATVLARVQPALDRSGRPCFVRACPPARGATQTLRAKRLARQVRQLVPDQVSVLVVPGGADPRQGLVGRLARRGDVDLLVVPDLRAVDADLAPARRRPDTARDERSEAAR